VRFGTIGPPRDRAGGQSPPGVGQTVGRRGVPPGLPGEPVSRRTVR